jgi:hypothetical protein
MAICYEPFLVLHTVDEHTLGFSVQVIFPKAVTSLACLDFITADSKVKYRHLGMHWIS